MKFLVTALATALAFAAVADELKIDPSMLKKETGNLNYVMELDGKNSIVLDGIGPAPKSPKMKNRYLSMSIKLPQPVDMTSRTLNMKLRSDYGPILTGLYIRGYNTGSSKPSMSWVSIKPGLFLQKEFREISLVPGSFPGALLWQTSVVAKAEPPTSIDRLQFLFCSSKDQQINLAVRDIEFESESELAGTKKFWQAVGNFNGSAPSSFSKNPVIECDEDDGMYELEISGHSTVNAPAGKNWYEAASFTFAEPISLENKTLSFQIKRDSDVSLIYIRGYAADSKNWKEPEFSYSIHARKNLPVDTWVPITLGQPPFFRDRTVKQPETPNSINRVEMIFSTTKPNEDFSVELRDMKLVDRPAAQ